jgi:hypothetical protein
MCEECKDKWQQGQDDYQSWLWNTIADMRRKGFDLTTLEELEQRTY